MNLWSFGLVMQSQDLVFLGIQSAPSLKSEKVEFPLVLGLGFPDTKTTKTILIRPKEDWDIFSGRDKEKDETVLGYSKQKLFSEGLEGSDVLAEISGLLAEREAYSLWPDRDNTMLTKLDGSANGSSKVLSALGLFNQLVTNKRFISIELRHKLIAPNYPRNSADVRWMIVCYHQCWSRQ